MKTTIPRKTLPLKWLAMVFAATVFAGKISADECQRAVLPSPFVPPLLESSPRNYGYHPTVWRKWKSDGTAVSPHETAPPARLEELPRPADRSLLPSDEATPAPTERDGAPSPPRPTTPEPPRPPELGPEAIPPLPAPGSDREEATPPPVAPKDAAKSEEKSGPAILPPPDAEPMPEPMSERKPAEKSPTPEPGEEPMLPAPMTEPAEQPKSSSPDVDKAPPPPTKNGNDAPTEELFSPPVQPPRESAPKKDEKGGDTTSMSSQPVTRSRGEWVSAKQDHWSERSISATPAIPPAVTDQPRDFRPNGPVHTLKVIAREATPQESSRHIRSVNWTDEDPAMNLDGTRINPLRRR